MDRVCVFMGAANGSSPEYAVIAEELGREIARRGLTLVYGGGGMGLMGVVARAVSENGGQVIGIIPTSILEREAPELAAGGEPPAGHQVIQVRTMEERKQMMFDLCDGMICLPGGIGTLNELFSALDNAKLNDADMLERMVKPIVLLDVHDFYAPVMSLIEHVIERGFARDRVRSLVALETDVHAAVETLGTLVGAELARRGVDRSRSLPATLRIDGRAPLGAPSPHAPQLPGE